MVLTGPTNLLKGHRKLYILRKNGFGNFASDAKYLDMKFTFFSYLRELSNTSVYTNTNGILSILSLLS